MKDPYKEQILRNMAQEVLKEYYEKRGKEKRPDLFKAIVTSYYCLKVNLPWSLEKFFSKISKECKKVEKERKKKQEVEEKSIPIFLGKFGQTELFPSPQQKPAY